jgi:AraC family transcriptional regulator
MGADGPHNGLDRSCLDKKIMRIQRDIVFDRKAGKAQPISPVAELTSAALNWSGFLVEEHHLPRIETREVVWLKDSVFVNLDRPVNIEFQEQGQFRTRRLLPGQVSIRPSRSRSAARTSEPNRFLMVAFDPSFLSMAWRTMAKRGEIQLQPCSGVDDRLIEGICLELRRELEQGAPSGKLYSETLATSLAVHLATQYGVKTATAPEIEDHSCSRAVRQALEHINEHFTTDLSLGDIAKVAGLSPFHFTRVFKRQVGLSPYQFLLQRRIDRAKQLLLRQDRTIAAVALEVGFYDQSHFTNHFRRICGVTPRKFALSSR